MVLRRYFSPTALFTVLLGVLMVLLLPRAILLAPLYVSSDLRTSVQSRLAEIADQHGWIQSDIRLRTIGTKSVKFIHTPHTRIRQHQTCFIASLEQPLIIPCGRSF